MAKPQVEAMIKKHPEMRLIYADIGLSGGRINWSAPIVRDLGVQGIPYFLIVNGSGSVTAQGKAATARLQSL